jgi:hypothetical protein
MLSSPVICNGASMPLFPLPASGIALAVMEALNRLVAITAPWLVPLLNRREVCKKLIG